MVSRPTASTLLHLLRPKGAKELAAAASSSGKCFSGPSKKTSVVHLSQEDMEKLARYCRGPDLGTDPRGFRPSQGELEVSVALLGTATLHWAPGPSLKLGQ